jgi:hypothetical protein
MTLHRHASRFLALTAMAALGVATAVAALADSTWDSSSGKLPQEICPPYTLVDNATPEDPVLGADGLTLSTSDVTENMLYIQPITESPAELDVTVRMQFVSGTSLASNRGPAVVAITSAPNEGILFFIGENEVFFTQSGDVKGPTALVNTTDAQHTYHIEITGPVVLVTYDGTKILDAFTYGDGDVFGPTPRLLWGEGPDEAFSTSVWQLFEHNGAVCDPGTTTATTVTTTTDVSTSTDAGATTTTQPGDTTSTTETSTTEMSSSTTTSTLPSGCDDSASGSLDAIICRLTALDARVQSTSELGRLQKVVHASLSAALKGVQQASDACGSTNGTKKASQRLKRVGRHFAGASFRLRSLSARKKIDAAIRDPFIQEIRSLKSAVSALRKHPCA